MMLRTMYNVAQDVKKFGKRPRFQRIVEHVKKDDKLLDALCGKLDDALKIFDIRSYPSGRAEF